MGDWSNDVSQQDSWLTYHSAEALAESDHGMGFVGGNPDAGHLSSFLAASDAAREIRGSMLPSSNQLWW